MNKYDTIPFVLTLLPKREEPGSMDQIEIKLGEVTATVCYAVNMGWHYAGIGDRDLAELWCKSSWPDKFPHRISAEQILMVNGHAYFMETGGHSFPDTLWVSSYLTRSGNHRFLLEFSRHQRTGKSEWRVVQAPPYNAIRDVPLILEETRKRYPNGPLQEKDKEDVHE